MARKKGEVLFRDLRRMFKSGNSYVVAFPPRIIRNTKFNWQKDVRVEIYYDKIVIKPAR